MKESGKWIGDYKECISVDEPGFQPKYCLFNTPILQYGMCVPKSCSSSDVASVINFGNYYF
jgi:hypothetical protein